MRTWLAIIACIGSCMVSAYGEVKIIVHPKTDVAKLDAKAVEQLFLARNKKLPDGSKAVLVSLEKGDVHEEFVKSFLNRSTTQFSSIWKKAVFTGQGTPPKKFGTEKELIAFVAATPGAIGYVGPAADVSTVKVAVSK